MLQIVAYLWVFMLQIKHNCRLTECRAEFPNVLQLRDECPTFG